MDCGRRRETATEHRADQLYDLDADVLEQRNLAADPTQADVLADMKAQLDQRVAALPHAFDEFGKKKRQE